MGQSIIIKELCKRYGSLNALKNVNLSVNDNEIFGLLGPNGAGKSTLIHIISCLVKPTSGDVFIKGLDVSKNQSETKKIIGVALQKNSFYESLSVKENIMYFGSLYGINKKTLEERMNYLLELFSLKSKKDVAAGKLSGGMRKKLNIICSLIHNPSILILDEPTAGLDPMSKRNLWDIIKKINENNTTVIIASHLMEDIEALCHRVAIMVSGNLIIEGTLHELKTFVKMTILRITIDPYRIEEVKSILKGNKVDFEIFDNVVMMRTQNAQETYNYVRVLIGPCITAVESVLPSIEDVFLYFVGKEYET
jgi:ABC-2 type transport system ATP-binding protein